MPRTDVYDILNAQIPITSYQEQTQIVSFLDTKTQETNELIAAEHRKIELLKEYRQSLISEAVTGKIDVRTGCRPMPTYTEQRFEEHIEHHLNQSGYRSLQSADYDKSLCLIPDEVLQFIQDTQPKEYLKLKRQSDGEIPLKLLNRISREIEHRGVVDVLQKGVKDRGCHFHLTYSVPPAA